MTTTQYLFFSGKGGVGKTTMACATAVHHARQGKAVLIVTTDPASNLADVFEQPIGHKVTPLGMDNLWGMEIEPDKATEEFRERALGPLRGVLPENVLAVMEEQFNSPCTTEIAAFDRFVDLMIQEERGDSPAFDVIIFDTAPTGHTIRLLELPVDWSKHIEESAQGSGNTCIGPVANLQQQKAKYDTATALLANPDRTTFIFVTHADLTGLYETKRASGELASIGVRSVELIVNGLLPEEVCGHPFFRQRYEAQQRCLERIAETFPWTQRRMYLRDREIKGLDGLAHVAADLYPRAGAAPQFTLEDDGEEAAPEPEAGAVSDPIAPLLQPEGRTKAVFFTGKGGVGKTVVSCAAAFHLAEQGYNTLLLTTDPAAHIGAVLGQEVGAVPVPVEGAPGLSAVSIDQEEATEAYRARILADARTKYAPDMLKALEEELNSPCTEEMAAFDRFMEYLESEAYDVIVIDTAPTGHTLRLLELPFSYNDQAMLLFNSRQGGGANASPEKDRLARIVEQLKDPQRAVFAFVVYPESTPIEEAARAMADLEKAGIRAQFVVANQVIGAEYCTNAFFRSRRAMQVKHLRRMKERFRAPVAILPLLAGEVAGLDAVREAAEALTAPAATPQGA